MNSLLLIMAAFVAVILCTVILIQNPKTGAFDSRLLSRSVIGSNQSITWAEKITLSSAALLLILCLGIGIII